MSKKTEPAIVKSSLVDFAEKMSDWLKDAILKGARPPLSSARIQIWSNTFRSFWVPVDADRIDSFISQFPRGMEWVGEALVDAVDYYDQRFFASALSSALGPLMNDGARLCLFGGARKSSSLMSYVIDRRLLLPYQELGEALSRSGDGKSIIFIDDCMLSGTQAIHIFSELIGVWHRKPYKYHVGPLSERQIENLRSFDIVFLPALGTNLAANRLSKFLKANKILHRIEIARVVPWLSTAGMRDLGQGILLGEGESLREPERQLADPIFGPTSRFSQQGDWKIARELCQKIGFELLASRTKENAWSEARRRGSALGYSGMQGRLVFEHSVPKTTLTLLWCSGRYEGKTWVPLFPPRD